MDNIKYGLLVMSNKRSYLSEFNSLKSAQQYKRRNRYGDQEMILLINDNGLYEPLIITKKEALKASILEVEVNKLRTRYEYLKLQIPPNYYNTIKKLA